MANSLISECTRNEQIELEFESRFSAVSPNAYVNQFRVLLTEAKKRFESHLAGDEIEPDESLFRDDIRAHREKMLRDVAHSGELPAMPKLVEKLDRVISDPNATMKDAAEVVSLDPSIAAKTLQLVNSPLFSLNRQIDHLDQALSFIGLNGVRHIVFTASILGTFCNTESEIFSPRKFWEHSLAVGSASSLVARTLTEKEEAPSIDADQAFLAGLLHDVGKMLIAQRHREKFAEVCKLTAGGQLRRDAELAVFGLQHTDLGHALLSHWGLPKQICDVALAHHEPSVGNPLEYIVHLGDAIAHGLGYSADLDHFPRLDPRVWATLDLSDGVIERISYEVMIQVVEASSILDG